MNDLSDYDYNIDEEDHEKDFPIYLPDNNFTNLTYSIYLKSMRYCKAKKNKPIH